MTEVKGSSWVIPERARHERRRILLALDAIRDQALLETAAELAAAMEANLQALFVESDELFRVAQLPFAREIGFGSAVSRQLELPRLQRDLKNRAADLERRLRRCAAKNRLEWSFSVVRGVLPAAALSALPEADLYFLPRHGGAFAPDFRHPPGPVALLLDGSEASRRALQAVAALSGRRPLKILIPQDEDTDPLRAQVAALLNRQPRSVLFLTVEDLSPGRVAATLRRERADLLVIGRSGAYREAAAVSELLTRTGLPLIVAA